MLKKIAVIGPESTGKSALCKALADHYNDNWVPEFARSYLENLGKPYQYHDLSIIAQGQMDSEIEFAKSARKFLFCDTTILTVKIWSEFKFGKADCKILDIMEHQEYHIHLLCDIDMPWEDDPLRENPNDRSKLLEFHKKDLDYYSLPYKMVSGIGSVRTKNAISIIDNL